VNALRIARIFLGGCIAFWLLLIAAGLLKIANPWTIYSLGGIVEILSGLAAVACLTLQMTQMIKRR
jgi:hypothetical protein